MRHAVLIGLLAAAPLTAVPEVLIRSDFGAADQSAAEPNNTRVTGVLPAGWQDNSGWAPVWADYQRLEDEGRRFVRINVTRLESGRCQTTFPLPDLTAESFLRLTLTARSADQAPFEVYLRERGAPYASLWSVRPSLTADWQDLSYDFRLDAHAAPIGLYLAIDRAQSVDLARLELHRMSREDLAKDLETRYAASAQRNLLRCSRFPLGLQSGWSLDRDNSDGDRVTIAPDPALTGPSGAPALRCETAEKTWVYSEPFGVPLATRTHTFSLQARGSGNLAIQIFRDGTGCGNRTVTLAADRWQRVEVPFQPQLMARSYTARLEFNQTIWLDAVQVAVGEQAREYVTQQACEVSLALPPSAASAAHIVLANEPARVRYAVTGDAPGRILRLRVVDVADGARDLPAIPLAAGFLVSGEAAWEPPATRPYGPFRLEAWVENAAGERLSPYQELVVLRVRQPRYWNREAPASHFGVHTNSTTRHALLAKAVGANWTRLHDAGLQYIGWYHLERQKGQWTFYDEEIRRYRRHHVHILGELGTAPEWASYFDKARNGYFDRFYQPRSLDDYATYVRTVATRYKGVIEAWDVWNEPWIHAWWGVAYDESKGGRGGYVTSQEPQADFARMMATAYRTAKAVDPTLTMMGFNTTTGAAGANNFSGTDWTKGVLAAGGLEHTDAIAYHQYTGAVNLAPDDDVEKGFQAATGPIREQLGTLPRPVWMTEGSAVGSTIGDGLLRHTLPYANDEQVWDQADRLARWEIALLARGVAKIFVYSMHSQGGQFGTGRWRALVTNDGYPHPTAAAHAELAWRLEDAAFVKRLDLAEQVHGWLFGAPGRSVVVLARAGGRGPFAVPHPAGVEVTDLFGNPVPAGEQLGATVVYLAADVPAAELERRVTSR